MVATTRGRDLPDEGVDLGERVGDGIRRRLLPYDHLLRGKDGPNGTAARFFPLAYRTQFPSKEVAATRTLPLLSTIGEAFLALTAVPTPSGDTSVLTRVRTTRTTTRSRRTRTKSTS